MGSQVGCWCHKQWVKLLHYTTTAEPLFHFICKAKRGGKEIFQVSHTGVPQREAGLKGQWDLKPRHNDMGHRHLMLPLNQPHHFQHYKLPFFFKVMFQNRKQIILHTKHASHSLDNIQGEQNICTPSANLERGTHRLNGCVQ